MSLTGETLGNYKIEKEIGRGSMAEVYRASHRSEGYQVAIKIVHSFLMGEKSFLERFRREAEVLTSLDHPNIVYVYEYECSPMLAYLVMEYLGNQTLEDRLRAYTERGEEFPIAEILRVMEPVASAVDYAHAHGLIHRDLKPANILFRDNGDPVLTDFGLAFLMDHPRLSASNTITGTPAYLSPEQAKGQPGDSRSDIYALGVILYELLTGYPPFQGNVISVIMKHISEAPPSMRTFGRYIPKAVEEVVMRALDKQPHQRFQSAQMMMRALREAIQKTMPDVLPVEEPSKMEEKAPAAETKEDEKEEVADAYAELAPLVEEEQGAVAAKEDVPASRNEVPARPLPPLRREGATPRPVATRPRSVRRGGIGWRGWLMATGVILAGLACLAAIFWYTQSNETSAVAPPQFVPGQRVTITVPWGASTSVYNGCPPYGVLGLASDGQIAYIKGRRTCGDVWYYEIVIPEAATDDWDGSGTVEGKYLK